MRRSSEAAQEQNATSTGAINRPRTKFTQTLQREAKDHKPPLIRERPCTTVPALIRGSNIRRCPACTYRAPTWPAAGPCGRLRRRAPCGRRRQIMRLLPIRRRAIAVLVVRTAHPPTHTMILPPQPRLVPARPIDRPCRHQWLEVLLLPPAMHCRPAVKAAQDVPLRCATRTSSGGRRQ